MKQVNFNTGVFADAIQTQTVDMGICTCPVNCDCRQKCSNSNAMSSEQVRKLYSGEE